MKSYYVYILTNDNGNVMYTGVTNNLERRVREHRSGVVDSFTKKYNVHKLVYFEVSSDIREAIEREKRIKGWTRKKKNALVKAANPEWCDLAEDW